MYFFFNKKYSLFMYCTRTSTGTTRIIIRYDVKYLAINILFIFYVVLIPAIRNRVMYNVFLKYTSNLSKYLYLLFQHLFSTVVFYCYL